MLTFHVGQHGILLVTSVARYLVSMTTVVIIGSRSLVPAPVSDTFGCVSRLSVVCDSFVR